MTTTAQKTGLASRMREWMKGRARPFTGRMIYDGLGIESWEERQKVHNALGDFIRRGEIAFHIGQRKRRQKNDPKRYKYNHRWRRARKGTLNAKVYKAIHVSGASFAAADIERLTDASRNHVEKLIRKLREDGYLEVVCRRKCASGVESVYHVTDRDRFRQEVVG